MSKFTEGELFKQTGMLVKKTFGPLLTRFKGTGQSQEVNVSDASIFVLNSLEEGVRTRRNLKVGETAALSFGRRKDFVVYSDDTNPVVSLDVEVINPTASRLKLNTVLGFVNMELKRDRDGNVVTSIATGGQDISGEKRNQPLYIAGTDVFFSQKDHLMGPGWRLFIQP